MADLLLSSILSEEIASIQWDIQNPSRGGGQSIVGTEQTVMGAGARWICSLTINVFTENTAYSALAFRSLKSKLRGRDRVVRIPEVERRGPAWLAGIINPLQRGVPHSDGAYFSDGAGYAQSFSGATLSGAHGRNASQVTISLGTGLRLLPGHRFSTPDGYMHEISDLIAWDGGNVWTVEIFPWLRSSYAGGTDLEFDNPACRMKLAKDDSGLLNVTPSPVSVPTIEFVEAF